MANAQKTDGDDDHEGTLSRRQFIQGVIAASAAASAAGLSTGVMSASSAVLPTTVLTMEQGRALTRIVNHLIPAEGVMPGAGGLGIAAYIDTALAAAPHLRRHFLDLLTALPDADAVSQLSEAELDSLLRRVEHEQSESFDILLQATYSGYYSHPQVQTALEWVDFERLPPRWEPFDSALLDQVRKRGAVYKNL